jgi:excinuclease ABC subunit C
MTASVLDGVPGLGESRQRRLLEAFGSVKAIRAADREDFRRLSWLPDTVADTLYDHLHATVEEKLVKGEGIHDG